jgi:glycosyltransferase involved in cell wall biosynthesis
VLHFEIPDHGPLSPLGAFPIKILFVCSGNVKAGETFALEKHQAFVYEQSESLKKQGVEIDYFLIRGHGLMGYLRNIIRLRKKVAQEVFDVIHAHYGLAGLVAVFQRRRPVVITFIGEMNYPIIRSLSVLAMRLSFWNIFVSEKLRRIAKTKKKYSIIPYGVDFSLFYPIDQRLAREALKIAPEKRIALFSSSRNRRVKNYPLAREAIDLCESVELIELMKGHTREIINLLFNACDFVLMTSRSEGSPQVIKEAMACNCPIISTDVGDVGDIIKDTEGCFLTTNDPRDIVDKIQRVLERGERTKGRDKIGHLDINIISSRIIDVYEKRIRSKPTFR